MTERQYKKALIAELHKINRVIDQKVASGERYTLEARRHKILLEQAKKLKKQEFFQKIKQFCLMTIF